MLTCSVPSTRTTREVCQWPENVATGGRGTFVSRVSFGWSWNSNAHGVSGDTSARSLRSHSS